MNIRFFTALAVVHVGFLPLHGSNLSNPAVPIPAARISAGASYHLEAATITAREVPAIMNRLHARFSYAPASILNAGVDVGATKIEVIADTTLQDTVEEFVGNFGFSGGVHCKLGTPFLFDSLVALVGIGQAMYFASRNEHDAEYGGIDMNGTVGVQFHIKGFGYIAAGPRFYMIRGRNKAWDNSKGTYGNKNNIRGWLSIDFFPRFSSVVKNIPYISVEVSVSPDFDYGGRAPLEEIGFSVSIGAVSKRLYGEETGIEWQP